MAASTWLGGTVAMVVDSMGGSTINTGVLQVLVDVVDFRMTAQQAVSAPRFHHQGVPINLLTYDGAFAPATLEALRLRRYTVEPREWPLGDVQLIVRTQAGWDAASDPRGRGEVRLLPRNVNQAASCSHQAGCFCTVADLIHWRIFKL